MGDNSAISTNCPSCIRLFNLGGMDGSPLVIYTSELVFPPDLLGGIVLGGSRVSTSAMLSPNWLTWSSSFP